MKFNKLYILLFAAVGTLCSCTGDWLDTTNEGAPSEKNFWKADASYISATNGLYYIFGLEETYGRDLFWEQGASDDIFYSRSRGNGEMSLANFTYDGNTESRLSTIYDEFYTTMAAANNIVYHALQIPEAERSAIVRRSLGEAYFMRAFAHFMIAYRYGRADNGVPFVRYEDFGNYEQQVNDIPTQQATVMDDYKLIIEDLQHAADNLDWFKNYGQDDYGRPTKDAALAYMVKTYAYWARHDATQWAHIPALVDRIESEGERGLLGNYADVFTVANNWSKEYIWSVNSSGSNYAGSLFPAIMLENKGWGIYNGWGNFKPTLELYAEYNDQDARRSATILEYGDAFTFFGEQRSYFSQSDNECGFQFNKYMEPFKYGSKGVSEYVSNNGDRPTTALNLPLCRFAEMLLFKAEALIMQGKNADAAAPLNRIAQRAHEGVSYTAPTMTDLMHERRCELAGEWTDRRFDLIRWAFSGNEAWNRDARARLITAKHGLKHVDRANPASPLDTAGGSTMTINGKTYQGVIGLTNMSQPRTIDENHTVFPYRVNTVIQSNGKLRQNAGYASN